MSKTLDQRLQAADAALQLAGESLAASAGKVPSAVEVQFRRTVELGGAIPYWREMVIARDAARAYLQGLETRIDRDDLVEFGGSRVHFSHARLIGFEAYLALTWSLADRISALVGRVFCSADGGAFNDPEAVKLVSHFLQDEKRKESTAGVVFDSIRQTFGWGIAISYALRNHFVHDGARKDVEFFQGRTSADAFKVSDRGWQHVQQKAGGYNVRQDFTHPQAAWPTAPKDDVRKVLEVCEHEMDNALGVLVGTACTALSVHVTFLLGGD